MLAMGAAWRGVARCKGAVFIGPLAGFALRRSGSLDRASKD
jgi:hypothetical protein